MITRDLTTEISFGLWFASFSKRGTSIFDGIKIYQYNLFFRRLILELVQAKKIYSLKNYFTGTDQDIYTENKNLKDQIKDIASSGRHSLLLTDHSDVYTFGDNHNGQLGVKPQDYDYSSQSKTKRSSRKIYKPTLIDLRSEHGKRIKIKAITVGKIHSIILT